MKKKNRKKKNTLYDNNKNTSLNMYDNAHYGICRATHTEVQEHDKINHCNNKIFMIASVSHQIKSPRKMKNCIYINYMSRFLKMCNY